MQVAPDIQLRVCTVCVRGMDVVPDGVDIVEGDIADPAAIERSMQGVGTVYHLAAVYREAKHPDLRPH